MQVAVQARHFTALALFQIEHGAFQHLGQQLRAFDQQQGVFQAQGLDHTGEHAAGQTQLALAAITTRRRGRLAGRRCWLVAGQGGQRIIARHRRFGRRGDVGRFAAGQRRQRVVGKGVAGAGLGRRTGSQGLQLAGLAQGLLHLGDQLLAGEGFADKVADAGLDRLHHVFLVAPAGDHDEGRGFQPFFTAAPAEQLEAGQLGHFPVAEDQVEVLLGQHLLGLAAVDRLFDMDAGKVIAQALLHQVANKRRVIHHQHTDFAH